MIKPRVIAAGGCHLPRWPHPLRPGICQGFQTVASQCTTLCRHTSAAAIRLTAAGGATTSRSGSACES